MKHKVFKTLGVILGLFLSPQAEQAASAMSEPQFERLQPLSTFTLKRKTSLNCLLETYQSAVMKQTRKYEICLPPDYQQNPHKSYPVIFLLHGGPGDETDWFNKDKGDALLTLEQLYLAKKLPFSIVVTPDGNDLRTNSREEDPQYIDGANGNVATAIGAELVQLIQNRYRTLSTPKFWAIGGLSSGAWGAMNIGLHHLDRFTTLFGHSGYFTDLSGAENSPLKFVHTLTPQQRQKLRIYFDIGQKDERFYLTQNQQFDRELTKLTISHLYQQFPGGHSWHFWRKHLNDSLTFVGKQWQEEGLIQN